jgi:glyoxylase-like metal-dependent hydrolase (beta-lactamase superfamily II)
MQPPAILERPSPLANPRRGPVELAPDVLMLRQALVNVFLIGRQDAGDRGWVLVDTGAEPTGTAILAAAESRFGRGARPSSIVLTHGHFDHVGALARLSSLWDVPVYAHRLEHPYLNGRASYPPADPAAGGGAMTLLSRFYPRGPVDVGPRLQPLPAGGDLEGLPGWRWVFTPGHSPGHVSLFRGTDRLLIVGDAFVTTKQESALAVLLQPAGVRRPPAYYTTDWVAARASVAALAALGPDLAATGHGPAMGGSELRGQLDALLHDWDEVAVPHGGRYAREPVVSDLQGPVRVPPPVTDPAVVALGAAGVTALVGGLLWSSRSSDRPG